MKERQSIDINMFERNEKREQKLQKGNRKYKWELEANSRTEKQNNQNKSFVNGFSSKMKGTDGEKNQ